MESSVGHRHAIRGDEQAGTTKGRRVAGQQAQLYRPVGQFGPSAGGSLQASEASPWCLLIEGRCLPLLDADRPLRAGTQTRSEAVTEAVGHEPGLAADDVDCTLLAGGNTLPASVAQLLVDRNDAADQLHDLRLMAGEPARGDAFQIPKLGIGWARVP